MEERIHDKNNENELNVSFEATSCHKLGNDFVEFRARFGGITRDIQVPVDHVVAIYARENGQGMAFPTPTLTGEGADAAVSATQETAEIPAPAAPRGLRLASSEPTAEAAPAVVPTAVPTAVPPAQGDGEQPDPTPPTGRPSLKRIK